MCKICERYEMEENFYPFWGEKVNVSPVNGDTFLVQTKNNNYLEIQGVEDAYITKIDYCPFCGKKFEPIKKIEEE